MPSRSNRLLGSVDEPIEVGSEQGPFTVEFALEGRLRLVQPGGRRPVCASSLGSELM